MTTNQAAKKLIIFDWDGTLSDSVARIARCIQLAADEHQLPQPSFNQAKEIIGLGLNEAIRQLFPSADEPMVARFSSSYSAHYRREDNGPSEFFPGVISSLEQLRASGYLLAVATGKSRAGLDRVFAATQLTGFFHASRCADETRSKPHPLMLQELLAEQGVEPQNAVMVGDTEFDMEMAVNANMPRIAVSYGAHDRSRLLEYQPLACLDNFSNILKYI